MTPYEALIATAKFTSIQAQQTGEAVTEVRPFLVTGLVLLAQQAASLALHHAGDRIPAQSGATELILRAATPKHLPQPYTLPFDREARQAFDRLVERRNAFMHPRGLSWTISDLDLATGLETVRAIVQHLLEVQVVDESLSEWGQRAELRDALENFDSLAAFIQPL